MSILDDLLQSARALEGAAVALSHCLRPSTKRPNPSPPLMDTFRECEAFAITTRAVMEEAKPVLPLLSEKSHCIGRSPSLNIAASRVCNGFDSLALILITLFDASTSSILEVAGNHTRWLVSPLQAIGSGLDRVQAHHGQLRAMYGIIHMAAKIVTHVDVSKTLFVEISGSGAHPELNPARWRAAIKMDDFYGRHFGFHYSPEMRNVLRVVNIARESVAKSHAASDGLTSSPLVQNMSMLGWGWVYSNMVLMNNLGLPIDAVNQIGADNQNERVSIAALRKFMNLVEEPIVAGVSGLASADVTIDQMFSMPHPGTPEGLDALQSPTHDELLRQVLITVTDPVQVRVMSYKPRPIQLPSLYREKKSQKPAKTHSNGRRPAEVVEFEMINRSSSTASLSSAGHAAAQHDRLDTYEEPALPKRSMNGREVVDVLRSTSETRVTVANAKQQKSSIKYIQSPTSSKVLKSEHQNPKAVRYQTGDAERVTQDGFGERKKSITETLSGAADSSFLATTIKTELIKLHSNVSSFLGIEEARAATGLIFHFHGGGFVSQSSNSHAAYMKEWCASVPDAVLLSIDYKLAPEHKFPIAVHECVYAYIWALQNAERLGTRADRVVFAGDSAGGNLAIATALKLAQLGVRQPDGICIAYPALHVRVAWSPSRLLSFFDPMLPLSVLELCVKSYVPDDEREVERGGAFISPVGASAGDLKKLPAITMICGSLDPLLDDSIMFAHRLKECGREGDIVRVYDSMPHGFLNMSLVNDTARQGMQFLAKMIAEYLQVAFQKGKSGKDGGDEGAQTDKATVISQSVGNE